MSLLTLLFILLPGQLHQYHISKLDINVDVASQSYQVTVNVFIDDLELALKNKGIVNQKIGTENEAAMADLNIEKYVKDHLTIRHDDKILELVFVGKEVSEGLLGLYCYLEADIPNGKRGKLHITNTILTTEFDDQKNIVTILNSNKREEQFLLDGTNNSCQWQ